MLHLQTFNFTLTLVRNEAVVVLRITTFLDQDINLLSLQLLS